MCEALRELFEDELIKERECGLERGLEQGLERGLERGLRQGEGRGKAAAILEILEDLGSVPDSVRDMIMNQTDFKELSVWLKLAAKATSMEAFIKGMES